MIMINLMMVMSTFCNHDSPTHFFVGCTVHVTRLRVILYDGKLAQAKERVTLGLGGH